MHGDSSRERRNREKKERRKEGKEINTESTKAAVQ
jgi:hypothetical protein